MPEDGNGVVVEGSELVLELDELDRERDVISGDEDGGAEAVWTGLVVGGADGAVDTASLEDDGAVEEGDADDVCTGWLLVDGSTAGVDDG